MRVAAVIVTYNRVDHVLRCVDALRAQSHPLDEIIVVDNGSADGTLDLLRRDRPDVTVVALQANTGAAGGFAAGVAEAMRRGHDWAWTFNDDDAPLPRALETLLRAQESMPTRSGIIACGRLGDDGLPWTLGGTWRHRVLEIPPGDPNGSQDPIPVDVIAFQGTLISLAMAQEIGLPRADLFMMCEELDYCLRARSAGWTVMVVPEVLVTALGMGGGLQPTSAWRAYYQTRNHLRLALDRRSAADVFWWLVGTAKYVAAAAARRDWARVQLRLRGAVDGLRGVSGLTVRPGSA